MIEKRIGKIQSISFGFGGYDDAMIGIQVTLGSDKECWGVGDFRGTWANRGEHATWSIADQYETWGEMTAWFRDLLRDAKVLKIEDLVNVPVEVTFEDNALKEWRILTEAI